MIEVKETYICDLCDKNYMLDPDLLAPPAWISLQVSVANQNGILPDPENSTYLHFCSLGCLREFIGTDEFRTGVLLEQNAKDDNTDE